MGVISVLFLAALIGAIMVYGTTNLNADNVATVTLYNAGGTAVSVSGLSTKGDEVKFTPAGDAAVITLTLDHNIQSLMSANTIYVDISGLQPVTGNTAKYWRVVISDGTNEVVLDTVSIDVHTDKIVYSKDDLKGLDSFKTAIIKIKFYNENGSLTNYVAGNMENTVKFSNKVTIRTDSIGGFFTSVAMMLYVAVRRAKEAITGTLGSAIGAVLTSNAIVPILVGLAVLIVVQPNMRRKIRSYI